MHDRLALAEGLVYLPPRLEPGPSWHLHRGPVYSHWDSEPRPFGALSPLIERWSALPVARSSKIEWFFCAEPTERRMKELSIKFWPQEANAALTLNPHSQPSPSL
eukprot:3166177-Prymnesium_polylepis.1